MTVGLIGTGRMAGARIGNLSDHQVRWVCSRSVERGRAFLSEAGRTASVWASVADALSSEPVDAVIDTSPNALHRPNAQRVFEAGSHLLVEYPHACTVEEGEWMLDAASRKGLTLHVGLTHRFGARHAALAGLMATDGGVHDAGGGRGTEPTHRDSAAGFRQLGTRLGRVYSYSEVICSGNPISRWFDDDSLSGGMFVASMYHYIDHALSLFGEPAQLRAAYASTRDRSGIIRRDTGHAVLSFAGPTIVNIAYARGFEKPGLGSLAYAVFENGYLEISGNAAVIRAPDGEQEVTLPSDDAVRLDTNRFFDSIEPQSGAGENQTAEWAQTSLVAACSLQEDAGLTAGRRTD